MTVSPEDIDLVVDRGALAPDTDALPSDAHSPRQGKERAKKIAKACYAWTEDRLLPALRTELTEKLGKRDWSLAMTPITDNQETSIVFHYPKLYGEGSGYLHPEVKVELVAKADAWPSRPMPITAYLNELFPDALGDGVFNVNTMQGERTMPEKGAASSALRCWSRGRPAPDGWCLLIYRLSKRDLAERSMDDAWPLSAMV